MQTEKTKGNLKSQYPIDAVIPWVDGNDKQHKSKMLPYLKDKSQILSEKFRTRFDHVNEIEYAVDSILKFAPYIRKIFLVTDNQTPDFLQTKDHNKNYSKIEIIDHTVIFAGYEKFLPTFNNRPIDTCLYRIPDLAEHFLYFNDDVFLINDTNPETFFKRGLPILRGVWSSFEEDKLFKKKKKGKAGNKLAQQKAARYLGFHKYFRFRHTPHPLRKSTFETYFKNNEDKFLENIKYKFRSTNQFTAQGLANHVEIKNKTCYLEDNLRLLYFRSYKKPLFWYKYKLNIKYNDQLFLGLQSLDRCPDKILKFLLNWLETKVKP